MDEEDQVQLFRATQRKRFEKLGVRQVAAYAPQWSGIIQELAWEWLREQDKIRQQEVERALAAQEAYARRTLLWVKIASVAACVAVAVAMLAWLLPR